MNYISNFEAQSLANIFINFEIKTLYNTYQELFVKIYLTKFICQN